MRCLRVSQRRTGQAGRIHCPRGPTAPGEDTWGQSGFLLPRQDSFQVKSTKEQNTKLAYHDCRLSHTSAQCLPRQGAPLVPFPPPPLLKSLTNTQKFKFLMKTHLWGKKKKEKYYLGSTPVFHPNKTQLFSPCFKAILYSSYRGDALLNRRQKQSPPAQTPRPHPTCAEGTSQR